MHQNLALIPVFGWKIKFCAPDQIRKTKIIGSVVPGSFKIFQNSFEAFSRVYTYPNLMLKKSATKSNNLIKQIYTHIDKE